MAARRLDIERPINHRDIERRITPQDRGGKALGCARSYDLRILWQPTSGTCSIDILFNAVTETITFQFDDTHADVLAEVNAHSEFVAESVTASYLGAGSFPSANMVLVLPSGATITSHSETLVDAALSPEAEFRVDICGCA